MNGRREPAAATVVAVLAGLVGLTLVGAPLTMADWGEQTRFRAEAADSDSFGSDTPTVRYSELSPAGQRTVDKAIDAEDAIIVYGHEDRPGEPFRYTEHIHVVDVVRDGQHYRVRALDTGGFPFVYWLLESPLILYGVALLVAAKRVFRGSYSPGPTLLAAGFGAGLHLVGPEFDFPLGPPVLVVGLGTGGLVLLGGDLLRRSATTGSAGETDPG